MTLCEHGCGTELIAGSWTEAERGAGEHTPERCQSATRALLDDWKAQAEKMHKSLIDECETSLAAEKRAVDLQALLDEARRSLATSDNLLSRRQVNAEIRAEAAEKRAVEADLLAVTAEGLASGAFRQRDAANARAERFRAALASIVIEADSFDLNLHDELDAIEHMGVTARAALAADPAPEASAKASAKTSAKPCAHPIEKVEHRCTRCGEWIEDAPDAAKVYCKDPNCDGSGACLTGGKTSEAEQSTSAQQGSRAAGSGPQAKHAALAPAEAPKSRDCFKCGGTGTVADGLCAWCHGSGTEKEGP